jgi:CobQ-like glutamine amidotransferase family enzyme
MSGDSVLRIVSVFPELLGTYGDGGNALVLEKRLAWRDLPVETVRVALGQPVPEQGDLYVIGGGEDSAQMEALAELRRGNALQNACARGVPVFAVCAGFQILGTSLSDRDGVVHPGLCLVDVDTRFRTVRAVGEVVAQPSGELGLPELLGFENHGGGTWLGPDARALAGVRRGVGNGAVGAGAPADGVSRGGAPDQTAAEGALQGSVVATYLHGPVLARNPGLADLLLTRASGQQLADLPAPQVDRAREHMLDRLGQPISRPSRAGR